MVEHKEYEPFKRTVSAGGVVRKVINDKIHIILTRPWEPGSRGRRIHGDMPRFDRHSLAEPPQDRQRYDWLLPKGHVEEGESIEEAALREVKEETGLKNVRRVKKLGVKERLSAEKDEYKTIHYFLFDCEDDGKLPKFVKDDGNKLEPRWFPLHDLPKMYWPEQQEIIEENLHALDDTWYEE